MLSACFTRVCQQSYLAYLGLHGNWKPLAWATLVALGMAGCGGKSAPVDVDDGPPPVLSAYGLFVGDGRSQLPAPGVVPYDLNTPLFSDYTSKYRFLRLPPGTSARYDPEETFQLPVGTVIAKTFAQPHDRRDPAQGERLLETRILIHEPNGWAGLPYVWNKEQTEATLALAGGDVDVQWVHDDGTDRSNNYIIPNANQCKGCHKERGQMAPIGLKARHLNREYSYNQGVDNQLMHWVRMGALTETPSLDQVPRFPVWNDPSTGTVTERARAWLEINCAHCHNPLGPAINSGLDLMARQDHPVKYGVFKSPVAAGRGSGGLHYDIVPGEPEKSILFYRIASTEPQVMMPELGKRLVHVEGVELVKQWIEGLEAPNENRARLEPVVVE